LLDALNLPQRDREGYFVPPPGAACTYCAYDGLCGRKWEAFA
jgi:hypothetical protein